MKKLFLSIIAAMGIAILYWGGSILKQSQDASSWPQTTGDIISSSLTINHLPHYIDPRADPFRWYGVQVQYEYTVGDGRYSSDRLAFLNEATQDPREAIRVMKYYRLQHKVPVYYDPNDPGEAVLQPGYVGDIFTPLLIGALLAFWGLFYFFRRSLECNFGPENYIQQGYSYQSQGKFEAALWEFNQAIKINPYRASGYIDRGNLYFQQRNIAKIRFPEISSHGNAILNELMQKGILEEASPTEVRLNLYHELTESSVLEIAKGDFDKIWGLLEQSLGNLDKAISDFKQALAIDPHNGVTYFALANAYLGKKEYEKARDNMQKAMKRGFKISPEILKNVKNLTLNV